MSSHTADEFSDVEWAAFWRSNERQIMTEESILTGTIRQHPWNDHAARVLPKMLERTETGTARVQVLDGGRRMPETVELCGFPRERWMAQGVRILAGDCWGPSPTWGIPPVGPTVEMVPII